MKTGKSTKKLNTNKKLLKNGVNLIKIKKTNIKNHRKLV